MCLWISVSGFNLRIGIEEYIYIYIYICSQLLCAKSYLTMWNNLQKACQSNQLHTPPVHFRKHSQCTSKSHMQEEQERSDRSDCTGIPMTFLPQGQAKRKPAPVWLKLLIRHSLFCSLIHMQPPTCHFSWGLNSDEVKVADFSTGGQRFCCPTFPSCPSQCPWA